MIASVVLVLDKPVGSGIFEETRSLSHLDHEGAGVSGQVVACTCWPMIERTHANVVGTPRVIQVTGHSNLRTHNAPTRQYNRSTTLIVADEAGTNAPI